MFFFLLSSFCPLFFFFLLLCGFHFFFISLPSSASLTLKLKQKKGNKDIKKEGKEEKKKEQTKQRFCFGLGQLAFLWPKPCEEKQGKNTITQSFSCCWPNNNKATQ